MTTDEDIDEVLKYQHDPLGFVQRIYPWGEAGELKDHDGPRTWQAQILDTIGQHLRDPVTRVKPLRIAVASGHGIGKSALIAQITHWAMSTMADTRVVITANTDNQLRTKTWPEVSKWFRLADNASWFKPTATSVYSADPDAKKSWRADAIPWSENNTEAFAGLHNVGKRIVMIMDEGSGIATKVCEVAEGVLTDENTEIIWIMFGNPTRNTGYFRECFRKFRHLWRTWQIDSRTVEGTNKEYLDEIVATYGEDSDLVKVRVRGVFPAMSAKQFISTTDVDAARGRHLKPEQYNFAPKILTCDPAWEGDDELVIGLRQGLLFKILATIPKNDNDLQVAAILARHEDNEQADAVFIDAGYGTGIVSAGRSMGRNWQLVWFSAAASKPGFKNKRAEMWDGARLFLKDGGAIDPHDDVLYQDLIGPETVGTIDGTIQLESKKDMKARGLPSPGRGDALALSFAFPVVSKAMRERGLGARTRERDRREHDPYRP
ncbi:MAG TPA: terminase [Ramlibacter sp.]|nr:terminase [Ramlibacter sp.]